MKKRLTALLIVVVMAFVATFSLVACNKTDPLNNFAFEKDGQAVYDDFVLPKVLGDDYAVTWTSDNDAIKLTARDDDYLAQPVFPETGTVKVTLTLSDGKNSREFTVKVNAIDVEDIASNYKFSKRNATVSVDFKLDQKATYKGKEATITWSVKTGEPYITVNGDTCVVDHQNLTSKVTLTATFSYKGETTNRNYNMTVEKVRVGEEAINTWYTVPGLTLDLSGYIVAVHNTSEYQGKKQATFYMIDDTLLAGYYVFNVTISESDIDKVVPGMYVNVTGAKTSLYNGLMETSNSGTATFDPSKKNEEKAATVRAIDNDLFAAIPTTMFSESRMVSLTNWTVDEVKAKPSGQLATKTILTLKKNDVKVDVVVTKYLFGVYDSENHDTYKGLIALCDTLKKDDVVSVTGLLGRYLTGTTADTYNNNYQIMPLSADDVKKTTADPAGTTYPGTAVGEVIKSINTVVTENKLTSLITAKKTVTMPASTGDVAITYSLLSESNTVAINENVVTFTPGKPEEVTMRIGFKSGDYESAMYLVIKTEGKTDAEMVASVKGRVSTMVSNVTKAGEVTLPSSDETYTAVNLVWSIKGTSDVATIASNKLTVATLPVEETSITLTVSISCGEATDTAEVTIKIAAAPKGTVISVTGTDLGLSGYADSTEAVDISGAKFAYAQLAQYTNRDDPAKVDGIQMRIKDGNANSALWTAEGFAKNISKVELVWTSHMLSQVKTVENKLKLEFGNDNTFSGETLYVNTVANQQKYEVTPSGEWKYVRISINVSGGTYLEEINFILAD